jgi:hypothetical protein
MKTPVEKLHEEYKRIFRDVMVIPEQVVEMCDVFEREKEREKKEYATAFRIGEMKIYSPQDINAEDYCYYRFIREMI